MACRSIQSTRSASCRSRPTALLVALGALAVAAHAQTPPTARKPLPAATVAALAPAWSVPAVMPAAPCGRVDIAPLVQIPVGKSTVIRPPMPVSRILLGNPDNVRAARPTDTPDARRDDGIKMPALSARPGVADVDVLLLSPTEIYLLGKTIGSTNVVMLDRSGACTAFDVVVGLDISALRAVLGQLLPDEKGISVSAAFDSVVLSGTVSDNEALTRVTDLAHAYVRGSGNGSTASGSGNSNGGEGGGHGAGGNTRIVNMLAVAAPQQVMLEVKVAEISKSLLDQFGVDFSRAYTPGDGSMVRFLSGVFGGSAAVLGQVSGTGAKGVPFSSVDAVVGGTVPVPGAVGGNVTATYDSAGRPVYTTTYGNVPGRGVTNIGLKMQKNDGLVKVLAEPTIMAISGQTGSFLAGGKIFIPVSQGNDAGGRTVTLEEKEFGVSVQFTPSVLGNGRINLKVRPEVSELSPQGVSISGINGTAVLPAFTSRKAETTVQLMDGQSFAIGGLIKNNTTTNVKAFPFLGEIPVLGALFRSTEFQTDRAELVFVITPRLVKPLPADYRLPTDNYAPPSRSDLILKGRMEGERTPADNAPALAAPPPTAPAPAAPAVPVPSVGGGFDTTTMEKK